MGLSLGLSRVANSAFGDDCKFLPKNFILDIDIESSKLFVGEDKPEIGETHVNSQQFSFGSLKRGFLLDDQTLQCVQER